MRKWKCALFLTLLITLLASAALSESETVYIANPVPTDRLHLRRAAKKGAESLGRFYNGTTAQVLDKSNGFTHVCIGAGDGAIDGWMLDDFLSIEPVAPALPSAYIYGTSADGTVSLHAQPDEKSAVISTYSDGMLCDILGDIGDDWVYVFHEASGTSGYLPVAQIVRLSPNLPYIYDAPTASVVQRGSSSEPIHLRAQPSTKSRSLGRYYPGTQVYVLSESLHDSAGWALVCIESANARNRRYGYMRMDFLKLNAWIDSQACYATLTQDAAVLQKALSGAPQLGTLRKGARVKPYAIEGDYACIELSEELTGCVPLEALTFSAAQIGNPSNRLYRAKGLCIVSIPNANEHARLTAYATCDAYYPLSRVNSSPAYSSGFAQGDCLVLLAELGEWSQVFDGYSASFVPTDSLNILRTGDFTSITGILDAGEYVAGETLPAGFYSYHLITPGETGLIRIEGDGFTREYEPIAPALYSFYLPKGARLTIEGENAALTSIELGYRESPFNFGYASGRILVGANMTPDEFWVMPEEGASESYMVITTFEEDMSAAEPERIEILPVDENGFPQQHIFAPSGCFIEYVGCVFGVNG